jgi:TonB-linked SusC/RagA family outer membrane protein
MKCLQKDVAHLHTTKVLIAMKLMLMLLLFTFNLNATGFSQHRISLKIKKTEISEIFRTLESLSSYRFLYNNDLMGLKTKTSVNVKDATIDEILPVLLFHTNMTYHKMENNLVVIKEDPLARKDINITGQVTDSSGAPLSGVSVQVKNTDIGTVTNNEGRFTISVPDGNSILVFSRVGYETVEHSLNGGTSVNIILAASQAVLDQVVVVGYGTQRKRDLTGSIASVRGEEIAKMPATNPIASLQGKVAGLTISNVGNAGGSPVVRIRGVNSTTSASPVYVVDGLLVDNIEFLNPMDIESIDVLKDPSSIAIYGLRAANGVIAVTTKQSARGKTRVNFQSIFSMQQVRDRIKVTDAEEFIKLFQAQEVNMNVPAASRFNFTNFTANTNWQDQIFQNALMSSNNISVSNNGEKSSTYLNIGYTDQDGVLKNDSYQRYLLHLKEEIRINKSIKVGADISGYHASFNPPAGSISHALWAAPVFPIQVDENTFYSPPVFQSSSISNPAASLKRDDRNSVNKNYRALGSVFAEIKLPYNLTWRSTVYGDLIFFTRRSYTRLPFSYVNLSDGSVTRDTTAKSSIRQVQGESKRFQQDHTLTYDVKLGGGHSLTAVGGITTLYNNGSVVDVSARDNALLIPDDPNYWYLPIITDPALTANAADGRNFENAMFGSFLRAAYSYNGKYLLNATLRRDGSSKFDNQNKWATSGSVGLGWVISQEAFFEEALSVINFLKLRGSWGRLANSNGIPDNLFRPGLRAGQGAVFGDIVYPSIIAAYRPDPNINYEFVGGFDAGLDVRLLDNRLNAEFSVYNRTTTNILSNITLPNLDIPFTTNLGKITNKGIELSMGWQDKIGSDFSYNVSANFSHNRNTVNSIGSGFDFQLVGNGGINLTRAGQSIGYFYGYRQVGIYQTTADLVKMASFTTSKPGDIAYADIDGDGVLTAADREYLGSPFPAYNFGGSVTLNYKGVDLLLEGQGQTGHKIYAQRRAANFTALNFEANRINAWTGPGTTNVEPILDNSRSNNFLFSTYYLEPGDYFRLRTLQLGYTFNPTFLSGIGISNARFYVSGQNLKTWSKVTGYSPEPIIDNILGGGADNGRYPVPAVYSVGLNLTF